MRVREKLDKIPIIGCMDRYIKYIKYLFKGI